MSAGPARLGGATALMRQLLPAPCPTWWEMAESRLLLGGTSWSTEQRSYFVLVIGEFSVAWLETTERHGLGYHQKIEFIPLACRVMRQHVDANGYFKG